MASRLLVVAVLAGVIAAGAGVSRPAPRAAADDGLVQGMAIGPWNSTTEYDRLARMGTNTVYLDVYYEADSPTADSVHSWDGTVADSTLTADIQKATADGMRVALMPKVWCSGCQYGWRGDLQPTDPDAFMRSYTQMVLKYARLGQQNGAWLLFLGSEMNNLQQYSDDWRVLATTARGAFRGLVTYQPNWDQLDNVSFWDALDLVTVSAYFPLTPTPRPSVAELKQAWNSSAMPGWQGQDWVAKLQNLAGATGKRVLIGEVGYRSSTTAAQYPWDEWDQATPDQMTQANAYQALLETFSSKPWWAGVIWWQWRGADQDAGSTDMSPKAKQAEQLLTRWWVQGWRPGPSSSGGPATTGGTAGRGASVLAARTPGTQAAPTPAASTSTAPTEPGDQSAAGPGLAADAAGSAAIDGPRSVARLARASNERTAALAVAVLALLAMGALWASFGLRRLPIRPAAR